MEWSFIILNYLGMHYKLNIRKITRVEGGELRDHGESLALGFQNIFSIFDNVSIPFPQRFGLINMEFKIYPTKFAFIIS